MPQPVIRKFTMADMMILIAGVAVGTAWTGRYYSELSEISGAIGNSLATWTTRIPAANLIPLSLALVVCRLRHPRPRLRRLTAQPGSVLLLATVLTTFIDAGLLLINRGIVAMFPTVGPLVRHRFTTLLWIDLNLLTRMSEIVPLVQVVCLINLGISGRWRAESSWIERAGRFIGLCWILTYVSRFVNEYYE